MKGKRGLEVFAGGCAMSRSWASVWLSAWALDICIDPRHDLNSRAVRSWIRHQMKIGVIIFLWFAFPCGTFSRARRNNSGPGPLRGDTPELVWGVPGLLGNDAARVKAANGLLKHMVALCRFAQRLGIPFVIENPLTSRLWLVPDIVTLGSSPAAAIGVHDFCQSGTPWQKGTKLLTVGCNEIAIQCRRCHPRAKLCSNSGKRHFVLEGKDAAGIFWTKRAEPYPAKFCALIASAVRSLLIMTFVNKRWKST